MLRILQMPIDYSKKVFLVTGHTGFKGSWLAAWLTQLGARVVGLALEPPSRPSHFEAAGLADVIEDRRVDIRDRVAVQEAVEEIQPDFVFHLAAQALVRRSYENPVETYQTNLLGTVHLLEALRALKKPCTAVLITSDKAYNNVEWVWGYRETDQLGGPDPYSASKACADIAIRSYVKSFFSGSENLVRIAVGRAGNVIGGGDWAAHRIVPDCVRAWAKNDIVGLRNPQATRPWQHVLEPLSGYLALAAELASRPELHGEAFNFGPPAHQNHTVLELVEQMARCWDQVRWEDVSGRDKGPYESGLLKLNCDKALHLLKWQAILDFEETVRFTADWYKGYYQNPSKSMLDVTLQQISKYTELAKQRGMAWAQGL
jgi:CDP-glucose 4,6-dehydratase